MCVLEIKAHSFAIITNSLSRSLDVGVVLASHTFDTKTRVQELWGVPTTTCRILILHLGVVGNTNASSNIMHDMNNIAFRKYVKEVDNNINDNIHRERSTSNTKQNVTIGNTPSTTTTTTSDGRKIQHNKDNSIPQITTNTKMIFRYF